MLIRVICLSDMEVLGAIEAKEVPSIGDTFWWKGYGRFVVIDREWHFHADTDKETPEVVTLRVKDISKPKGVGPYSDLGNPELNPRIKPE